MGSVARLTFAPIRAARGALNAAKRAPMLDGAVQTRPRSAVPIPGRQATAYTPTRGGCAPCFVGALRILSRVAPNWRSLVLWWTRPFGYE